MVQVDSLFQRSKSFFHLPESVKFGYGCGLDNCDGYTGRDGEMYQNNCIQLNGMKLTRLVLAVWTKVHCMKSESLTTFRRPLASTQTNTLRNSALPSTNWLRPCAN